MQIITESGAYAADVRMLLTAAFPTAAEADLVDGLRQDGDLALSLVACDGYTVVGYLALSPMAAPMKALGLGPLAVSQNRQCQGIGSALVRDGLRLARLGGWQAVFVLGDAAYYGRFGFAAELASGFASPYAGPHFMALALSADGLATREGRVDYAPAFGRLG